MTDRDPTNGELAILLQSMDKSHNEFHSTLIQGLDRVERQAIKTNGRISKLEIWRAMIIGGLIVTNIFVAIVGAPLVAKWLGR